MSVSIENDPSAGMYTLGIWIAWYGGGVGALVLRACDPRGAGTTNSTCCEGGAEFLRRCAVVEDEEPDADAVTRFLVVERCGR